MGYSKYELLWLLFLYSFLGWAAETAIASGKRRTFANRGFFSGPVCFIYGISAVAMTVFLGELQSRPVFLFLGCCALATLIEWCTGKLLERMNHRRWWDYSSLPWNFDGYVCLPYSVLWGILGTLAVLFGNELLTVVYALLPRLLGRLAVWILCGISLLDLLASLFTIHHERKSSNASPTEAIIGYVCRTPAANAEKIEQVQSGLRSWRTRLGAGILTRVERRMERAYDLEQAEPAAAEHSGCTPLLLFQLFFIGSLLGDITETIFCRITAGVWMSRSSLVWGPFSIVWGLAIALATALLHRDISKPDRHIFLIGTVLGGAYEYLCSVFTELFFGKVFWDYSDIPFNLGGRINLLYCFFWGIAAVVWIKVCYPRLARWLSRIPQLPNLLITLCLVVFMAVNMLTSSLALIRYDQRSKDIPARHQWQQVMDRFFDDDRMAVIYPNAKEAD